MKKREFNKSERLSLKRLAELVEERRRDAIKKENSGEVPEPKMGNYGK